MSTAIRVVPPVDPEVTALAQICQDVAEQNALERFEIAVKSRVAQGINDDNELRITDEMLHQVVVADDALEAATKPMISAAFARHRAMTATAGGWHKRWTALADSLKTMILKYNRDKAELARRQQAELDRAAAEERARKEAEARAALRDGDVAKAQEVMQEAAAVVAPVIMNAVPTLDSSKSRTVWNVKITDAEAVVRGIAAGVIPLSAIKEFDLTFFKKEAAKRGGLPQNWAGVSAWQEDALSVRR